MKYFETWSKSSRRFLNPLKSNLFCWHNEGYSGLFGFHICKGIPLSGKFWSLFRLADQNTTVKMYICCMPGYICDHIDCWRWACSIGRYFFYIYASAFLKFYKNLVSVRDLLLTFRATVSLRETHWFLVSDTVPSNINCLSELMNLFSRQSLGLKIAIGNTAILFSVTGEKSCGPSAV